MSDERQNNLIATGALFASLSHERERGRGSIKRVTVVEVEPGTPTNKLMVEFDFLKSPYMITVEIVDE